MKRMRLAAAAALVCCGLAQGQALPALPEPTLLVAEDQRPALSLDGDWHVIADPYLAGLFSFHNAFNTEGYFRDEAGKVGDSKLVEYDFARSPTIKVPGDWNTQAEWLRMYEGPLWYERHFTFQPQAAHRVFLHIGAANYRSVAAVNGTLVCRHEGGFTPFDCEITNVVKPGANSVVIEVDNTRIADGIPTLKTDWYNYGGLTRDVSIVTVPAAFIDDFELHLERSPSIQMPHPKISGYVHVEGAAAGTPVAVDVPELKVHADGVTDANGRLAVTLEPAGLTLWSPETPKLYKVRISAALEPNAGNAAARNGGDELTDEMGFRTITTRGTEILLNGKPIFLRGVSIHAEAPYRTGRAYSEKDVTTLLGWVKELGGNYARLAHYPHDERMTRAADRMGLLIWSEVPVYWAEEFASEEVFLKAKQQMYEEIRRDKDKASVILWSIANETPISDARTAFLTRSANYVRSQDATRLVTAALLVRGEGNTKYIDDPLGEALDVIGFNEYIGWYEKTPEAADAIDWKTPYDKPLIVSEFGGGARAGLHGSDDARWTEEYQASIFRHQLGMLNRIPGLRGMTPWVLMDFRSPVRQLPGIQDGFNRKGLISDQGEKKKAFFVLQKAYLGQTVGKAE